MSAQSSCGTALPAAEAPRSVPENWNPRHESCFESLWLTYLIMHSGEWCRADQVWIPRDAYQRAVLRQRAHEVVRAARRLGLAIETDKRRGYMVTGHLGLPRYLHLHERAADRIEGEVIGQLSLAHAEE